ncbi:MAG: ZIP family metal transporter [Thermostichus sp. BF3_bins_97]
MHPIWIGSLGSLVAGLATALGALPALFVPSISERAQGILLGFGGGVMLAATSFSLLVPGTEAAMALGYSQFIAALIMVAGMLMGAVFLESAHRFFPHEHFFKGVEGENRAHLKRIWLFIIAITLHNLPEGLAVGVGFATGAVTDGLPLAIGIGLQNIPEGLVVALSLVAQGYRRLFAFRVAVLTGLVEPIGGIIGATVVSLAQPLLPWGMAFAAGAMLFVISDEIIPESHRQGMEREATFGVMSGFVVMMLLDIALG